MSDPPGSSGRGMFTRGSSMRVGSGKNPENNFADVSVPGDGPPFKPQLSRHDSVRDHGDGDDDKIRRHPVVKFVDERQMSAREAVAAQEAAEAEAASDDEEEEEEEDDSGEAEEEEASSAPKQTMSLMDLLEETDRQMGLTGARYAMDDGEDENHKESLEIVQMAPRRGRRKGLAGFKLVSLVLSFLPKGLMREDAAADAMRAYGLGKKKKQNLIFRITVHRSAGDFPRDHIQSNATSTQSELSYALELDHNCLIGDQELVVFDWMWSSGKSPAARCTSDQKMKPLESWNQNSIIVFNMELIIGMSIASLEFIHINLRKINLNYLKQVIDSDAAISEDTIAYNIIPLDAHVTTNAITAFHEVQAAVAALKYFRGLPKLPANFPILLTRNVDNA
ncbi:hypothetical protein F2Q68_00002718 [Brassica cretica]|uniref:Uncharacterized protein n=1 Tax=Brassica cretica TaxID=69181 RepID=A0A8S9JLC6_BRACR|nr:hypothetical protein F2Q68_00002718 [Brassica cretica]